MQTKQAIIQLGIVNGLSSSYTSFVGVDEKTKTALDGTPMMTRQIKNQIPHGFGSNYTSLRYSANAYFDCDYYDSLGCMAVENCCYAGDYAQPRSYGMTKSAAMSSIGLFFTRGSSKKRMNLASPARNGDSKGK